MPNTKPIGVAYAAPAFDSIAVSGATSLGSTVGFFGGDPVARGAALTAQLTSITSTAPGTPDYAIQDLVNTSAYGFVTKDEGNTVLAVIANLQVRLAEVEARLEGLNLVAAN